MVWLGGCYGVACCCYCVARWLLGVAMLVSMVLLGVPSFFYGVAR